MHKQSTCIASYPLLRLPCVAASTASYSDNLKHARAFATQNCAVVHIVHKETATQSCAAIVHKVTELHINKYATILNGTEIAAVAGGLRSLACAHAIYKPIARVLLLGSHLLDADCSNRAAAVR
jgi:hypothetical protein